MYTFTDHNIISANCRLYSAGGEPTEVVPGYAYYMVP